MDASYAVILVPSTSHALRAEKILQQGGVRCKLIPVPRQLSSDCGVCVRILCADKECAVAALQEIDMEIEGVHPV